MSDGNRGPFHLEFSGSLDGNISNDILIHIDDIFNEENWTHSGMAYAFAEKMGVNDLEEFVYCLNEEIKRRKT